MFHNVSVLLAVAESRQRRRSSEDLMPSPLAEISTEVCWPDRVTAPDLSLIITTIRCGRKRKLGPPSNHILHITSHHIISYVTLHYIILHYIAFIHPSIQPSIHACMHTHTHTCVCVYIYICICTCMHTHAYTCIHID